MPPLSPLVTSDSPPVVGDTALLAPVLTSLRERLRGATGPAHQRLETQLDLLAPMPVAESGRQRMVELLGGFLGFHAAWEPALVDALPQARSWWLEHSRVPLIEADLRALQAPAHTADAWPACPTAARLCESPARAWGSVYVLEGSTLGGRVIARHLASASWLPPGGLRYFDPYGAETGHRWRDTLECLEALPASDWDDAVEGAKATFECLIDWLPSAPGGQRLLD